MCNATEIFCSVHACYSFDVVDNRPRSYWMGQCKCRTCISSCLWMIARRASTLSLDSM